MPTDVPMSEIFAGIVPFWFAMMVCIAILMAFTQEIATFIPDRIIECSWIRNCGPADRPKPKSIITVSVLRDGFRTAASRFPE